MPPLYFATPPADYSNVTVAFLAQVKDKSTATVSVKAAMKDFITMYADKHPSLTRSYEALIARILEP